MERRTRTRTRAEDKAEKSSGICCTPLPASPPSEQIAEQVKLLSALADPTRLQIVQMLSGVEEPVCVCDIVSLFSLGQPTISHHLKVLREASLVHWEKRGLWVYYSPNRETLAEAANYLSGLVSERILAGLPS